MSSENKEALKLVEDSIEQLTNLLAAMNLSMVPAEIHLKALKESLPDVEDKLKMAALELGGEAFWEM